MARKFKTGISSDADIDGVKIASTQSSGDEGGQIDLAAAQTNTTLSGPIAIDVYQNKLRFFETGGSNKGAYIDLSAAASGVGSNLLAGGGATSDSFKTIAISGQSNVVADSSTDTLTFIAGNNISLTTDATNDSITISASGSINNIDSVSYPDYIVFDTTPETSSASVGTLSWNDGDGSIDLILKGGNVTVPLGQEICSLVYNAEATTLEPGEAVYMFGAQGQRVSVKRASNAADVTSSKTFGLVAESIASGAEGFVMVHGIVKNLNTNAYNEGDQLYVGATPGTLTSTKPTGPLHGVFIGVVVKKSIAAGRIFVKAQNGYELDELHDVRIQSASTNHILSYSSASNIWINESILDIVTRVDGAGSNIDADLLDGQHGSYYQNADNLNAGTIPDARMPALTGDITTTAGTVATTLANTTVTAASYGSASAVGTFTVDSKGRLTAASNTAIAIEQSAVTNLVSDLALKAPLASPALTGTPTSTTAAADTNTTQIATTAYVVGQAGSASPVMDGTATVGTSLRYARQDHIHPTDTSRAPLASPTFTGTVTVPTPVNSTDAVTKGYVDTMSYTLDSLSNVTASTAVNNNLLYYDNGLSNSLWATRTSNFASTTVRTVSYGNNIWVAGGDSGQVRTSTNYVTWTTRNANFGSTRVRTIAYGNGVFVAVGDNAEMRSSTDGISWTTRTSNFGTSIIYDVAYGAGIWIATGYGGSLRTSADLATWTTRTSNIAGSNFTGSIWSVAYGNGVWAIGAYAGQIRSSTDGITWVTRTSNFSSTESIRGIAYGNGVWSAVGFNSLRTSTDLITWTTRTSPVADVGGLQMNRIVYGNGSWVLGADNGASRISTNGISWSWNGFGTPPFGSIFGPTNSSFVYGLAYGNSVFVAGGEQGNIASIPLSTEWRATSSITASSANFTGTVTVPTPVNSTDAATKGYVDTSVINTQSTSYTLVLADAGEIIEMNVATANTLTIPLNSTVEFPIGTLITIFQYGAGQTTITATGGVTIRSSGNKLKLTGQYSGATLYKRGTDEWVAMGDLSA